MRLQWQVLIASLCIASVAGAQVDKVPTNGASATDQTASTSALPGDLRLLTGKHIVVGRLPLCAPNTYAVDLEHAGKPATVLAFRPNQSINRIGASHVPAGMRPMMEDALKGGVLELQFEDGKKLDTCGELLLSQLTSSLTLAPGETVPPPAAIASGTAPPGVPTQPQSCPMMITSAASGVSFGHLLADALTTSELQRQIDETTHGGRGKHFLDLRVSNTSARAVAAFEFVSLYADRMGDETTSATYVSQNDHPIKPGDTYRASAMDRDQLSQNGAGKVTLFISRVRFDDDTMWQDNGSHSCSRSAIVK